MISININEAKSHFSTYLERAESGETVVVLRNDIPVIELKPIKRDHKTPRPSGLCKGEFSIDDDFDAPLPENIIKEFEEK